jgi:hypothetical protein
MQGAMSGEAITFSAKTDIPILANTFLANALSWVNEKQTAPHHTNPQ